MRGTVKMFNVERGYGFARPDDRTACDSKDVFLHIRNCGGGLDYLQKGDRVEFETEMNTKTNKLQATAVKIVQRANGREVTDDYSPAQYGKAFLSETGAADGEDRNNRRLA
jgi:cold shock CspA family protein